MTAKQKAAREKFKQVVAEAKKLRKKNPKLTQAQAVKQAWAIAKKVGAIKIIEKGESKSARPSATYQQKRTKKGTYSGLKKVGAADAKWGVYAGSSLRETFSDEMAAYRYADLIRSSQKLPSTFIKVKKIRKSKKVGAVKKAAKKSTSYHKDTKSHNVRISVMSGINNDLIKELESINKREVYFNDLLQKQLFEEAALKSQSKGKNSGIAKAQLAATKRYIVDIKGILKHIKAQKLSLKRRIK